MTNIQRYRAGTAVAQAAADVAVPTLSLPQELQRVLSSGERALPISAENGGGVRYIDDPSWVPPTNLPQNIIDQAEAALDTIRVYLTPMEPEPLGLTVGKMLAHRWRGQVEDVSDETMAALLVDWIEDLSQYPAWAVDDAIREWRRTQAWRPTIADIRGLCQARVADLERHGRLLSRLLRSQRRQLEVA